MVQQGHFQKDSLYDATERQQCQHITSKLPYGYYNTLENKQEWLIDKEAAEVVREIFELYVYHAMGTKQIAMQLQAEKRVGVEYHKKSVKALQSLLKIFTPGAVQLWFLFSNDRNMSEIQSIFVQSEPLTRIRL
mgnify:CR=1 FL=1